MVENTVGTVEQMLQNHKQNQQSGSGSASQSTAANTAAFGAGAEGQSVLRMPEPEPVGGGFEHYIEIPENIDRSFTQPPEPRVLEGKRFDEVVRQYTKWALVEYDLPIEWDRIEIKGSGRLSSAYGNCYHTRDHRALIKVSTKKFCDWGWSWERCKDTILHELIHACQARCLGYVGHGPTFRIPCRMVGLEDHADRSMYEGKKEPKYIAVCQNCGHTYDRKRMCDRVRNPYNKCGECKAQVDEGGIFDVYDNDGWRQYIRYWESR